MNVNKGLLTTIGIAALMVTGVACGDGGSTPTTTPTGTASPIPTPTQAAPSPKEITLTEVVSMAKGGEIESIEVGGDRLTIITHTGQTITSRKEEGSSIMDTLAAAGVDPLPGIPKILPTSTPVAKKDAEKTAETRIECEMTVELALENPMLIARGVDPIPSGLDAVNNAGCQFEAPISLVTLELHRGGNKVFAQEIILDPAVAIVRLPLSGEGIDAIPADIELGSYDRLIKVTNVDGAIKEVRSDPAVWLLDPISSPKAEARLALIAARRALVDSLAIPYAGPALVTFEPVEWPDAGLGCPKPGMMYAQVVTPGFRLAFEYEGQQYEYHTDRDGTVVVKCEIEPTPDSGSAPDDTTQK